MKMAEANSSKGKEARKKEGVSKEACKITHNLLAVYKQGGGDLKNAAFHLYPKKEQQDGDEGRERKRHNANLRRKKAKFGGRA